MRLRKEIQADQHNHGCRGRTLNKFHGAYHRNARKHDDAARQRRSHTAETGRHHREVAERINRHAEGRCVRRHGFVKGKGRGVTGPGENTEDEGPDAAADLGDFVGVFQELNKEVNDACGTQTGRKNAGGDNDADDVGVAFAHAVKKLLDRVLGVAAGIASA